MKNIIATILIALIFLAVNIQAQSDINKLIITPEKPQFGEKILIKYNAANSQLENKDKISLYAYCYSLKGEPESNRIIGTVLVDLEKKDNYWQGELICIQGTEFIGIILKSDDLYDNNSGNGYFIKLYDKNGNELVGSVLGTAEVFSNSMLTYFLRVTNKNFDKSYRILKKLFNEHPELKVPFAEIYIPVIRNLQNVNTDSLINTDIGNIINSPDLRENYLWHLKDYYTKTKRTKEAEEIEKLFPIKFPKGSYVILSKEEEIQKEPDFNKKIDLAFKYYDEFHDWFKKTKYITFPNQVFGMAVDEQNTAALHKIYDRMLSSKNNFTYFFPYFLISSLFEKNYELDLALKIALDYEKYLRTNKNWLVYEDKLTPEQIKAGEQEKTRGIVIKFIGSIYYLKGNKDEALKYFEEALKLIDMELFSQREKNIAINCFIDNKKYDLAKNELEKAVASGKADDELKNLLKKVYVLTSGSEDGYIDYYNKLNSKSISDLAKKLESEMINKPSPGFELLDLKGKKVKLSDYNGKVVILDFWATWCGPCKASFPAMQKVVDKFKENENVVFLFINTFEEAKDQKKNIMNYIKTTNYTFYILLDSNGKAANDFGVEGIPTKIVIGKDGNIKFKIVGSNIYEEQVLAEITKMIELAKK